MPEQMSLYHKQNVKQNHNSVNSVWIITLHPTSVGLSWFNSIPGILIPELYK